MMYQFKTIEPSSYLLTRYSNDTNISNKDTSNNGLSGPSPELVHNLVHISECHNSSCVYNRKNSSLRQIYQNNIFRFAQGKTNLKILFFGSFLLMQELTILLNLGRVVSEVHLTDYAYKDFLKNNWLENTSSIFIRAFVEFLDYTRKCGLNVKIYIHSNPDLLKFSKFCQRRIDIIGGIDFDYGTMDNRSAAREIANNILKTNGMMLLSQNRTDMVDFAFYQIKNDHPTLVKTIEYVKAEYYWNYSLQHLILQLLKPVHFIIWFAFTLIYNIKLATLILFSYCIFYFTKGQYLYQYEQKLLDYGDITP